jgi:acyl-CoA synthetase (AMP-forming)/AMP-acid ligase II
MCTVLSMPVLLGTTIVLGPSQKPLTAAIVDQILRYGNVTVALFPPFILEDLAKSRASFELLKKLKYIQYIGAPLHEAIGNKVAKYTRLSSVFGSTEAGPWFAYHELDDPNSWGYHKFCPSLGLEFEPRTNDMFEPVFYKKKELERWQPVFHVFPHLDRFPTKDLMIKHPTKQGLWKYVGRTDDLVLLSMGWGIYASKLEMIIESHPDVHAAIVGGNGRKRPFLLLEMEPDSMKSGEQYDVEKVWPVISQANEQNPDLATFSKKYIIFAQVLKPFSRTAKGTISKKATLANYQHEVDLLYDDGME